MVKFDFSNVSLIKKDFKLSLTLSVMILNLIYLIKQFQTLK